MERAGRVLIGVVCLGLLVSAGALVVDAVWRGAWISALSGVVAGVVFAIGAVGGLRGPERLPEKSVAELIGWDCAMRALARPVGGVRGDAQERRRL